MRTSRPRSIVLCVTAALCLLAGVAAAHAAHEPFNYPVGAAINNLNGGTGWSGPWQGCGSLVVAPGLTYAGLVPVPIGNTLGGTPGNACTRTVAPIVGAQGTSVVLRALIRPAGLNGTPASQATLGNSSGGTFIIGDLPQSDAAAGNWGLQNAAGRFYSNVPAAANTTVYLVAQIDFDVSGANDRMRLWVNPPAAYFTTAPKVDVTNANVGQFSGVFWQTQQQQRVDEISVETTKKSCVLPPNTTMVGWYPFDEAAGPLAANLATGNFGAHVNGPTPIQGLVARALRFDGIDDYVQSLSTIATNFGPAGLPLSCSGNYSTCQGDFSIDVWIRGTFPFSSVIVDKRSGTPPAIKGYSLFLYGDQLGLQLADGLGSGFSNYLSAPVVPTLSDPNNWHHIAVTVRRLSPTGIRFYYDGVLFGSANPTGRLGSLVNNSPLRIGTRTAASPLTGFYRGDLDELEIFNRVLTPAEVKSIFNAGPFGKCK
ncbi:MAG TPA: LamG domain-containing protein [Thermoanaerobaculia bacterium]|nr:LamG domain-containing protein [Thermoanaerobaculia bacterium]